MVKLNCHSLHMICNGLRRNNSSWRVHVTVLYHQPRAHSRNLRRRAWGERESRACMAWSSGPRHSNENIIRTTVITAVGPSLIAWRGGPAPHSWGIMASPRPHPLIDTTGRRPLQGGGSTALNAPFIWTRVVSDSILTSFTTPQNRQTSHQPADIKPSVLWLISNGQIVETYQKYNWFWFPKIERITSMGTKCIIHVCFEPVSWNWQSLNNAWFCVFVNRVCTQSNVLFFFSAARIQPALVIVLYWFP